MHNIQNKHQTIFIISIVIMILFGAMIAGIKEASANQSSIIHNIPFQDVIPEQACDKAQVVLLVDLSRSIDSNDTTKLRFSAPLAIADRLAWSYIDAYNHHLSNPDQKPKEIYFSVVYFATDASTELNWIKINPINVNSWEIMREEITDKLVLNRLEQKEVQSEGGISNGTDFIKAFKEVGELFQSSSLESQQDGCPTRLVMLFTDGNAGQADPLTGAELVKHMEDVQESVNLSLPGLDIGQDPDTYRGNLLYVTGFNNRDDDYWKNSSPLWWNVAYGVLIDGEEYSPQEIDDVRVKKAEDNAQLGKRLTDILLDFLGAPAVVVIQPGRLVVPPYVERMTLTLYKGELNEIIEVKTSDGQSIGRIIGGEESGIQTVELIRPEPGVYQVSVDAIHSEFVLTKQFLFMSPRLTKPDERVQQFLTTDLEIELVDGDGNVLSPYEDSQYNLNAEIILSGKEFDTPVSSSQNQEGRLVGSFTPIESGKHTLNITAYTNDIDNQNYKVIPPPGDNFEIRVDPVTVIDGDPKSFATGCAPARYTPLEIPLQIVNANSGSPTAVDILITWEIETVNDLISDVDTIQDNSTYQLNIISEEAGEVLVVLRASAANNINGELYQFYEKAFHITLKDGEKYNLQLETVKPEASGILIWFQKNINVFSENFQGGKVVIGRRFFFFPQKISLFALVSSGDPVNDKDLLPDVVLQDQNGVPFNGNGWKLTDQPGNFVNTFSGLELGRYEVVVDPQSAPCGVVLNVDNAIGSEIILVSDLLEKIAILVIALLIGFLIFLMIRFLVCRFVNPLDGFLAMINSEGHRVWFHTLSGKSCWRYKMTSPEKRCYVTDVKVIGWYKKSGEFTVKIKQLDPATGEKSMRSFNLNTERRQEKALAGGCRLIYVKTQTEVPSTY